MLSVLSTIEFPERVRPDSSGFMPASEARAQLTENPSKDGFMLLLGRRIVELARKEAEAVAAESGAAMEAGRFLPIVGGLPSSPIPGAGKRFPLGGEGLPQLPDRTAGLSAMADGRGLRPAGVSTPPVVAGEVLESADRIPVVELSRAPVREGDWEAGVRGLMRDIDRWLETRFDGDERADVVSRLMSGRGNETLGGSRESVTGFRHAMSPPPMTTPIGHPRWGGEFGQRVAWMIDHAIRSAEIQLDPPELGPMRMQLRLEGDQVQLAIQAHHPQVRDALEQHLPRLRDMLAGQGMELVRADVSREGFSGQSGHGGDAHDSPVTTGWSEPGAGHETDSPSTRYEGTGLLDCYA